MKYDQVTRWLGHFLKGADNGITDEPIYTYAASSLPMDSLGYFTWTRTGVSAWPPPGIQPYRLYLGSDSTLRYSPPTVSLNYDLGTLGGRTKLQADAIVTNAVALWTNVGTATITIGRGSDLPVDVTVANYLTYLNHYSDGLNPVIYDTDGSITDDLFGTGSKNSSKFSPRRNCYSRLH